MPLSTVSQRLSKPSMSVLQFFAAIGYVSFTLTALSMSDYQSLGLLLCVPILPFAFWGVGQLIKGSPIMVMPVSLALIFIESANFRVRDTADKSIDLQVGLKLLGIILLITLGFPTLVAKFQKGFRLAPLTWIFFLVYVCVTATYAVTPVLALVASFSLLGAFLYSWHIEQAYGRHLLISILVWSCYILCVGSIIAYLFFPSLGRMSDWSEGAFVPTSRLQGLFGTANAAGAAGAFGLLLIFLLAEIRRKSLFLSMVGVFSFCVIRSDNRMALVAMSFCFIYISFSRGNRGIKTVLLLLSISIGVVVFYAFGDTLLDHMARSGSADEVLSGTGRTRIWAVVIQLAAENPIFGLGYTSSGQILPKNEMLFTAAAHAHDMYLEVLFSGGSIGLGLLVASLVVSIKDATKNRAHREIGIVIFFLIYGITEPIMNGLVGFPTLSFLASGILAFSSKDRHLARCKLPARAQTVFDDDISEARI